MGSLDDVHRSAQRAQVALATAAIAVGLLGVIRAADIGFSVTESVPLIDSRWVDGPLLTFNQSGALVTAALGAVGLFGALTRVRLITWTAVAGFALVALQVLLQFGRASNLLGSNGSNLAFALAASLGLLALSFVVRPG